MLRITKVLAVTLFSSFALSSPLTITQANSNRELWIKHYLSAYPKQQSNAKEINSEQCSAILKQARSQLESTKYYNPNYVSLKFPLGDVPLENGVCADVIVRALRIIQLDLQELIYNDKKLNFDRYPFIWKQTKADYNIDHRRVPNQMAYLHHHEQVLPISDSASDYQACHIVAWDLGGGLTHIGLVTNQKNSKGIPLVIHHLSGAPQEEAVLFDWKIIGHYSLKNKQ